MSLQDVHPEVLKRVQEQLPEGALITDAFTESETDSVFLVTYKGKERRTIMPKASTCNFLANRAVEVEASQGDKLADLITTVSDTYRLYLVPDVDYPVPDTKVDFGCQPVIEHSFPVLPGSISLYGTVSFKIKNKTVCDRPKEKLPVDLTPQQLQLALVSKVFTSEGNIFEGDKLTQGFCKELVDYLRSLDLGAGMTAKKLSESTILDDYHDGVSRLVILKMVDKTVIGIRYEAELQDKPILNRPEVVETDEL